MFNAIRERMKQIREQMERERKSNGGSQGTGVAVEPTPVEGPQRTKRQERRKMFQEMRYEGWVITEKGRKVERRIYRNSKDGEEYRRKIHRILFKPSNKKLYWKEKPDSFEAEKEPPKGGGKEPPKGGGKPIEYNPTSEKAKGFEPEKQTALQKQFQRRQEEKSDIKTLQKQKEQLQERKGGKGEIKERVESGSKSRLKQRQTIQERIAEEIKRYENAAKGEYEGISGGGGKGGGGGLPAKAAPAKKGDPSKKEQSIKKTKKLRLQRKSAGKPKNFFPSKQDAKDDARAGGDMPSFEDERDMEEEMGE